MAGIEGMSSKNFNAEWQELKAWFQSQGYGDADGMVLKVLILVLRGRLSPDGVVASAAAIAEIKDAALTDTFAAAGCELPENIYRLIARWQCTLPCDPWILGEVYEKMASGRRAQGLYYTDPEVIDYILDHTVEHADIVANPYIKVLDPACGCGYFLLRAYDRLWRKISHNRQVLAENHPGVDWSDGGIHRHIITHNLWGADIDGVAAGLAAAGLLLKRPDANDGLKPNILVCDSLRRPDEDDARADRVFWSAGYHYVVGNPPYLSFGLRGAQRLDPDYALYLRKAFSASAEYKLSYYVLFMERGVEMLLQGGKLGFIVPDSFLLGRYFSKIRRFILDNTAIDRIAHIAAPVFKNAAVGMSAICILTKQNDPLARLNHQVTVRQADDKHGLQKECPGCCYSQNYFNGLPYNRFRIFSDLTVKNLIDKIDNSSQPLGNFASGHTGVRSVTKQSEIVACSPQGATWQPGLVSGSQIQRYGLRYEGHWLNIEPAGLYKGGWDAAVVSRRKILIRQTGYSVTACIDDNGYYHLNNIHSFVLKNDEVSLDYLLLLLNSRLMAFYYHAVAMEYGRAMAQTDIDTLELLPVRVNAEINGRTPELVRIMKNLVKRQLAGEEGLGGKIAAMDDLFDQLVYRIYGISGEELKLIGNYEAKLAARRRTSRRAGHSMSQ